MVQLHEDMPVSRNGNQGYLFWKILYLFVIHFTISLFSIPIIIIPWIENQWKIQLWFFCLPQQTQSRIPQPCFYRYYTFSHVKRVIRNWHLKNQITIYVIRTLPMAYKHYTLLFNRLSVERITMVNFQWKKKKYATLPESEHLANANTNYNISIEKSPFSTTPPIYIYMLTIKIIAFQQEFGKKANPSLSLKFSLQLSSYCSYVSMNQGQPALHIPRNPYSICVLGSR